MSARIRWSRRISRFRGGSADRPGAGEISRSARHAHRIGASRARWRWGRMARAMWPGTRGWCAWTRTGMNDVITLAAPPYCLAVGKDGLFYVGLKDHVEVYDGHGALQARWAAPGKAPYLTAHRRRTATPCGWRTPGTGWCGDMIAPVNCITSDGPARSAHRRPRPGGAQPAPGPGGRARWHAVGGEPRAA